MSSFNVVNYISSNLCIKNAKLIGGINVKFEVGKCEVHPPPQKKEKLINTEMCVKRLNYLGNLSQINQSPEYILIRANPHIKIRRLFSASDRT